MPLDTSSATALINQLSNPPNPLEQYGKTVGVANALMQFKADRAIQDIYGQSIDPVTGQVDLGKFNALAQQNPAALWKFGATQQQAGAGLQAQGYGTSAQLQAAQDQLGAQAAYLQPLMDKVLNHQPVTGADVSAALANVPPGLIPPSSVANINRQVAQIGPDGDASGIVRGAGFANQQAQSVLKPLLPGLDTQQTGSQIITRRVPGPMSSAPVPGPITMELTPESRAQIAKYLTEPHDWTDENNVEHKGGTNADYFRSRGIDPYSIFNNQNLPTPGANPAQYATGPVSGVTTGRAPVPPGGSTGAPPPASGQATGPPADIKPPTTSGKPSSTEAIPSGVAGGSQKAYVDAQDLQKTLPDRINPLINALSVLRTFPDLQTAGQETLNDAKQKLAAYGVNVPNLTNANAYSELAKYLAQYTRSIPGANRSDLAALDSAAATPHMQQGRQVIQTLTAKLVGSERLRAAGVDQFNSGYANPGEAAKHSAQYESSTAAWLSKQDPIAYAIDEMTPDEISTYYNGLSKAAKTRFENSAKDAYRLYKIAPGATAGRPATPPPTPAPAPAPAPVTPPPAAPPAGYLTPKQMYGG